MRDPFRILQLANPVTVEELTEPLTSHAIYDLYQQIVEAPASRLPVPARQLPRSVPQRRRRRFAALLAAVGTATVGWAGYQATREPTKQSTVACYAAPDLGSRTELVVNDGRSPLDICADLWRRGVFGTDPVPPLVACVIPSGAIAVLPGTGPETCRAVGANSLRGATTVPGSPEPSLEPGTPTTLDPATLTDGLRSAIGPQACVDESEAREIARRELAARGLSGWAVEVEGSFTSARPCVTVGVDTPEKTVRLIPAPPRR